MVVVIRLVLGASVRMPGINGAATRLVTCMGLERTKRAEFYSTGMMNYARRRSTNGGRISDKMLEMPWLLCVAGRGCAFEMAHCENAAPCFGEHARGAEIDRSFHGYASYAELLPGFDWFNRVVSFDPFEIIGGLWS